jgi:type VI secretion system secreted protein Hcp
MASDMFLKLDDIKGESVDVKHTGEIDVFSFSWGVTQSGSAHVGGGTGAGKAHVSDLTITKKVDKSSPNLFVMCCAGTPIKQGVLTIRKAGGKALEYMKITMNQAMITSVNLGGAEGAEIISETVSLNFASLSYEYVPQKADGTGEASITKTWNIAGNAAS